MNNNIIVIKYNIENKKRIKLFGQAFVKENKDKCKLEINNLLIDLIDYYKIENDLNLKELEIKLIGINNITNMSHMFYKCKSLISVPDIYK